MSDGLVAAARVRALRPNLFSELDAAVAHARAAGVDVIDASKGNPDPPTPQHIVQAMQAAVAEPRNHGYPSHRARPELAAAIATRYREDHGVALDPETQIAVLHGSHEGIMAAVMALADPGDTLIVPDPGYPAYETAAALAGADVRHVPLRGDREHQPDFDALDDLDRAAALILNYPHNPTGAIATAGTFEGAAAVSERLGAAFVHDFAYSSLGFDGRPLSALAIDARRTLELSTLSKTYSMAGWRIGYAAGAPELVAAVRAYQVHAFSAVFGATQDAAAVALAGDQSEADALVREYRDRRDLVVAGLRAHGWDVVAPRGGFFVWVGLHGADDRRVAERLLVDRGVAVAPGSGFGRNGAGHIRISLVHSRERLLELVDRLGPADDLLGRTLQTHHPAHREPRQGEPPWQTSRASRWTTPPSTHRTSG